MNENSVLDPLRCAVKAGGSVEHLLSILLRQLFRSLDEANIQYCILRNHETLPGFVSGSDVDVLISPDQRRRATELLENVAEAQDFRLTAIYRKHLDIEHLKFFHPVEMEEIRFDLMTSVGALFFEAFSAEELLPSRRELEGLCILPGPLELAVTVIQNWISPSAELKDKYVGRIQRLKGQEQLEFRQVLASKVGRERCDQFMKAVVESSPAVTQVFKNTRSRIWLSMCLQRPRVAFRALCSLASVAGSRILHPPGTFVAFVGPDGSGKSALATELAASSTRYYPSVDVEHLYPKVLPRLKSFSAKFSLAGTDQLASEWQKRQRKIGRIKSLISLTYYTLAYIIGYWLTVFPSLVKGSLVVYDRYCYDYLIDPASKGIRLPRHLVRMFLSVVPKPHLVIAVYCDPEVAHRRKNEIPVEEIARQAQELRMLGGDMKRYEEIDNSGSLSSSVRRLKAATYLARTRPVNADGR